MVGETFLRGQPCHPNVDAGFLGIALWVFGTNLSGFADRRLMQHDVNIMMVLRQLAGAESLERSTLHSACIVIFDSSSPNLTSTELNTWQHSCGAADSRTPDT